MPRTPRKRRVRVDDPLAPLGDPQPAPDGKRVVWVQTFADPAEDRTGTRLWLGRLDGRAAPRPITAGPRDGSPRWSPDGQTLAFLANRGKRTQIYLMPFDGGEPRALTQSPFGVQDPAWSPDGRRLVYVARTAPEGFRADKSALARNAPLVLRDRLWRMDGVGNFDERCRHLFVVDVSNGESRQVTDGDWDDVHPAWSPDGKHLAFVSDRYPGRRERSPRVDLWVVPARGGKVRKLTRGRGGAARPAWSPDGRTVAVYRAGCSRASVHSLRGCRAARAWSIWPAIAVRCPSGRSTSPARDRGG